MAWWFWAAVGFLAGFIFALLLENKMLRFGRKRGYRHAVTDILKDHIYCDDNGRWHKLALTYTDLTSESQKTQIL